MNVPRETHDRLAFAKMMIIEESRRQNLIARSTIESFDQRHLEDSLQLSEYLPSGPHLDVGSGGGMPGLFLACLRPDVCHLVEPRMKRANFLAHAIDTLGIGDHTVVHPHRIERLTLPPVRAITARAVASLDILFAIAAHLSDDGTVWVLPKGRSAASELDQARRTWHGDFRLVASRTDSEAAIVIASGVRRRSGR